MISVNLASKNFVTSTNRSSLLGKDMGSFRFHVEMSNSRKGPNGCSGCIGDEILPSLVGNYNKLGGSRVVVSNTVSFLFFPLPGEGRGFACTREIGSLVHVTLPVAAWICVAGAGNGTLNCDVVWQAQHQCDIWWQAQSIEASW